jgi:quinol-cytochrome oxidoreductase complex cytochrome b subunit
MYFEPIHHPLPPSSFFWNLPIMSPSQIHFLFKQQQQQQQQQQKTKKTHTHKQTNKQPKAKPYSPFVCLVFVVVYLFVN